ncbi:MAG: DUF5615 family PIN-like protein [Saprospiraceae bacterium]|nr:DUF5615 family PIN-like protein [Saprospiraceae bacterium]
MKLLANENFPIASIDYLQNAGFDVKAIRFAARGISDEEVLLMAVNENRIILTFDRDYGELIFKYRHRPPAGVIYFRLEKFTPELPGQIVEKLLKDSNMVFEYRMLVVDADKIRQKKY